MPALALTVQPDEEGLMQQPPRHPRAAIISGTRAVMIVVHAISSFSVLLLVYLVGLYWYSGSVFITTLINSSSSSNNPQCFIMSSSGNWYSEYNNDTNCLSNAVSAARTMVFITLIMAEVIRCWTIRHFLHDIIYELFSNKMLLLATFISITGLLFVTLIPPLQYIFGTIDIGFHSWLLSVGCALFTAMIDEIIKYFYRSQYNSEQHWNNLNHSLNNILLELQLIRRQQRENNTSINSVGGGGMGKRFDSNTGSYHGWKGKKEI